jgi:C1A family cysteine protease
MKRAYGWRPDLPDRRDLKYGSASRPLSASGTLPASVDLRSLCPAVYDQGQWGSCTANAIAGAIEFELMRQALGAQASLPAVNPKEMQAGMPALPGGNVFTPSRRFIYWNERNLEGDVDTDAGAQIRTGIKVVNADGAPAETEYPYTDVWADFVARPPQPAFRDAKLHKAIEYLSIAQDGSSYHVRHCLASGFPVIFGFTVYDSFESGAVTTSGVVPMPASSEQIIDGHAVVAVGYDDAKSVVIVRNSWSASWGQAGYFTMPYAYIFDPGMADDFWTIRLVA